MSSVRATKLIAGRLGELAQRQRSRGRAGVPHVRVLFKTVSVKNLEVP